MKTKINYKGYPINVETEKGKTTFDYIGNYYPTLQDVKNHIDNREIEFHRKPTKGEIKFGEGATHYKDFRIGDLKLRKDGRVPTRVKCKIDGLIYTRN